MTVTWLLLALAALDLNGQRGYFCSGPVTIAHPLYKPSVRDVYDAYNSKIICLHISAPTAPPLPAARPAPLLPLVAQDVAFRCLTATPTLPTGWPVGCSRLSIRTRPTDSVTREHAHSPRSARCGRATCPGTPAPAAAARRGCAAGGTTVRRPHSTQAGATSRPEALSPRSHVWTRARDTDAHGARGSGPGVRIYRRMNHHSRPAHSVQSKKKIRRGRASKSFFRSK